MDQAIIQTYSEIYCLLKYFPNTYIEKLPSKLWDFIKNKSDSRFYIAVDINKSLLEQNISEDTKSMLLVLKYNYWSTVEEKQFITKKLNENEAKYQKELRERYNPDNLFKTGKNNINVENGNNVLLIQYKETLFKKIIRKIKKIFQKQLPNP